MRELFLGAGILMISVLPFFTELTGIPFIISIAAIMIMALLAGLQSPNKKWVTRINTIIAALGYGLFQYKAISYYLASTPFTISWRFFTINQILAIVFFIALYYSSKTMRNFGVNLPLFFFGGGKDNNT